MTIAYQELKKLEVLEINSGKNLGKITDLIIEKKSGKISKIVVPGKKGGFLSCDSQEINYSAIQKIGDDVILVDLSKKCPKHPPNPCPCNNLCEQTLESLQTDNDGFEDE